ncbi:MAG: type 3 dihydrofolate reductase [Thiotrichaceae bacterium]|nr:type 3 dihydrofolate reductase [Thiotrichaceae bacterium]
MIISLIAGIADDRVIGMNNTLPWHLPADFAWFKENTLSKPIIMGHTTYLSIGKPLPKRRNIVLSQQKNLVIEGCDVVTSPEDALALCAGVPEVMVIGGAVVYKLFLPIADRLYLTQVKAKIAGDTFFPDYQSSEWNIIFEEHHQADDRHSYDYTFQKLERANLLC